MDSGFDVSAVFPAFNECGNLGPLIEALTASVSAVRLEIVAVNDGSTDGSDEELDRLLASSPGLKVVTLERRSGQSAALLAGVEAAVAPVVVTLDADGQNDPADIPMMLATMERAGVDAVVGVRTRRAVGSWKRVQARVANTARDLITRDRVRDTGCALRVFLRKDFLNLPRFDGMHRFVPTLLRLSGRSVVEVQVRDRPRTKGRSKYAMWNRLIVGLRDAFGVRWLATRKLHYSVVDIRTRSRESVKEPA